MMSPGMTALLQKYAEETRTSVTPPLFGGSAAQLMGIGCSVTQGALKALHSLLMHMHSGTEETSLETLVCSLCRIYSVDESATMHTTENPELLMSFEV